MCRSRLHTERRSWLSDDNSGRCGNERSGDSRQHVSALQQRAGDVRMSLGLLHMLGFCRGEPALKVFLSRMVSGLQ